MVQKMRKTSLNFAILIFFSLISWNAFSQMQGETLFEPSVATYQEYISPFTTSSPDNASMSIYAESGNMLLEMLMSRAMPIISGPGQICKGNFGIYVTEQGMSNYVWSVDGGSISGANNTYQITVSWSTPGTKTITVQYDEWNGVPGTKSVEVFYPEIVGTIGNVEACHDEWVAAIPLTSSGGGGISFKWEGGASIGLADASSAAGIPTFKASNPNSAPISVQITVTPFAMLNIGNGTECLGTPIQYGITVNPTPVAPMLPPVEACHDDFVAAIPLPQVENVSYSWSGGASVGLMDGSSSTEISAFTATNGGSATIYADITLSATYTSPLGKDCIGTATSTFRVTVYPKPTITTLPTNIETCHNKYVASISVPSTGSLIRWFGGEDIGLSNGQAGSIPPFTATNYGYSPHSVTITVIPLFRSGLGMECEGDEETFTITVNPTPEITNNTLPNLVVCDSDNVTIPLTSNVEEATFHWTGGSDIGLTDGSDDTQIAFIATLSGGTTYLTRTIQVTPKYNSASGYECPGTMRTFTITVLPKPEITSTLQDLDVCHNEYINPIVLTSTVLGATYSWTGGEGIGLEDGTALSGIPGFTATSTSYAPVTATIIITPKYVLSGQECIGDFVEFDITVNPKPDISGTLGDITVCNEETIGPIVLSSNILGTVFSWTGGSSIGLTDGNDQPEIPQFQALITGTSPVTVTIIVTPKYISENDKECEGDPKTFRITVVPMPEITSTINPINACHNEIIPPISLSGTPGTLYFWTGGADIGLADNSSSTSISQFTATNTSFSPATRTITVTPVFTTGGHNCEGEPITFDVTVNPKPDITSMLGNMTVCNETQVGPIALLANVPGTEFYWEGGASIGLTDGNSTLEIPVFQALITGSIPVIVTITVTPRYAGANGKECDGEPKIFTITVNPNLSPEITGENAVCVGETIQLNASVGGTWTSSNESIATVNQTGEVQGISSGQVTITYELYDNYGCGGNDTHDITVYAIPTPVITTSPIGLNAVCQLYTIDLIADISGGTWTSSDPSIVSIMPPGTGGMATIVGENPGGPITITYTVLENGCEGTATYEVTVHPLPSAEISDNPPTICENGFYQVSQASAANGDILWSHDGAGTLTDETTLVPTYTAAAGDAGNQVTLTLMVSSNNICAPANDTATLVITVDGLPSAEISDNPPTICENGFYQVTQASAANGDILWSHNGAGTLIDETTLAPTYTAAEGDAGNQVTLTLMVSSNNTGCDGKFDKATLVITVNPEPTIINLPNDYTLCNKGETFEVVFEGIGTRWDWEVTDGNIGLAITSGTNVFPVQEVSNTTNEVQSATITVTPVFEAGGVECFNLSTEFYTFTIFVNPEPTVANLPENYILCDGTSTIPITFEGVATRYQWVNIGNPVGGIPTGVQEGDFGAYEVSNPTSNPMTARIQVTPIYGENNEGDPCLGESSIFEITVLPTPTVTNAKDLVYCNNIEEAQLRFTGIATEWYWEQTSGADIGLPVNFGTDVMPAFTPTNSSNVPITAYFSVMPRYVDGDTVCVASEPVTFSITVTPKITMEPIEPEMVYCHKDPVPEFVFASDVEEQMIYYWEYVSGDVISGLPENGQDVMPEFEALNFTDSILSATYQVRPVYASIEKVCEDPELIQEFTIIILPNATVDHIESSSYCSEKIVPSITFTGNTAPENTTYQWEHVGGADIGSEKIGINIFPGFEAKNEGNTPITAFYKVTPVTTYEDLKVCNGTPTYFDITVIPIPEMTSPTDAGVVCSGNNFTYMITSNMEDIPYSWTRSSIEGINDGRSGAGNTAIIAEPLINNTLEPITVTYSLKLGFDDCPYYQSIMVDVYPNPSVSVISTVIACKTDESVELTYSTEQKVPLLYSITYSPAATNVGFVDDNDFYPLQGNDIFINIPETVKSGKYTAYMHVQVDKCAKIISYPFEIEVQQQTKITSQTNSDIEVCLDYPFTFHVLAEGVNLQYYWYKNGGLITTTQENHFTISKISRENIGRYYAKVIGACGEVTSDTVDVKLNPLTIVENNNVLSLAEVIDGIVAYQWYRQAPGGSIQAIYNETDSVYAAPMGLSGTYYVEVSYRNNTQEMSCSFTIYTDPSEKSNNVIRIYPNPTEENRTIYVEIDMNIDEMYGSVIKIYDILGKLLLTQPVTDKTTAVPIYNMSAGVYTVIVESTIGRVISGKLIVK
jgi:hypothetical protein